MVGFEDVLQQTPRSVTVAAQLPVIFPPEDAVVEVITEIEVVVAVASDVPVVKEISSP